MFPAGLVLAIAPLFAGAGELQPLTDGEMADVTGGEGVRANLGFLVNADLASDGSITPTPCPTAAEHVNGTPDCRFALRFNDITEAWLVVKDYRAAFVLNEVYVDSERTPATASGLCDAACQALYPSGFDPNDIPVLQLSYDHSAIGMNASWYDDAFVFIQAERVTTEFGNSGYLDDTITGAALGLRMADGPDGVNGAAQMRFDGRMQMYGY